MRYFICVAEEMHFGRAAIRLGISQPPLSQQIRWLEDELGVRLFDRTSRRVQLTEAGRQFLPQARRTIEQAEYAAEVARRTHRGEVGTLSIGFTTSAPFVPRIASELYQFRQTYPEVHLDLTETDRDSQLILLGERKLDIGFMRGFAPPLITSPLLAHMLLEEPLVVALRIDHPLATKAGSLTIADLSVEPVVLYENVLGAGFNEHFLTLCRNAGFEANIIQEASGIATLLGLVAAGFGLTVLARSLSALHPENITYRALDQSDAISRLWLVHQIEMSSACRLFVDAIVPKSADRQLS
jgi:DNA-binding transcriptional LysR family regulator